MLYILYMTGCASLTGMATLQAKGCLSMIEAAFLPTRWQVAVVAGLFGVIFLRNFTGMNILVAIHAALADAPEVPLLFIQMTGKTGRGCVGPFQGKFTFIVFFQSKKTRCKTIHRVAICTVGAIAPAFGKLLLMIVRMAGRTGIVRQRIGHFF